MVTGFLNKDEDKKEEPKTEFVQIPAQEIVPVQEERIPEPIIEEVPEELPYNDIEEKQEEYVETLPEETEVEEPEIEEIIEQLPKNEDGEIIGTDMHDDGSLNGEPGEEGIEEEVKEKPKSHFINI